MSPINRRSNDSNNIMADLLIALVVLISLTLILSGALIVLRRIRRQRKEAGTLPTYDSVSKNGRGGLRISTRASTFIYSEKQQLLDSASSSPLSPESVPEIRITFPEEVDKETGRRISKVVVVEVGEAGVRFVRPLKEEALPPYQQKSGERFASVDLERIGGLKEKETSIFT